MNEFLITHLCYKFCNIIECWQPGKVIKNIKVKYCAAKIVLIRNLFMGFILKFISKFLKIDSFLLFSRKNVEFSISNFNCNGAFQNGFIFLLFAVSFISVKSRDVLSTTVLTFRKKERGRKWLCSGLQYEIVSYYQKAANILSVITL